jgi:hypothetical protein
MRELMSEIWGWHNGTYFGTVGVETPFVATSPSTAGFVSFVSMLLLIAPSPFDSLWPVVVLVLVVVVVVVSTVSVGVASVVDDGVFVVVDDGVDAAVLELEPFVSALRDR